ncbi:uncharacterized protein LOC131293700 [Anopheles ziemanni]|uniref:uncharacterized protein LOC131264484 n=1 Tax=Anopheles coustani TaxID=139045 RepID=UPI0026597633|nr:uncharacterized protein LOC131264484 [Anopheles coustani]XP_058177757.1 uncharacterized protein LOC131293700 [Anopheles ziemanni]
MACFQSREHGNLCVVGFILLNAFAYCFANTKPSTTLTDNSRWKVVDIHTSGSDLRQPEYYDTPYGNRKDFVTSSYEDKYSGNSPSYGTKNRLGFTPFSSGSIYTPGGLYDRRPSFGTAHPIDYGVHDYETPYEYAQHGHGYGLNYLQGGKDITRTVLIPLAGAALLGIAAALVANPVLLHLGVTAGKRKRRDVEPAHNLAYRAQLPQTHL